MSMLISVVNFSSSLSDEDVQRTIRAVNRQISEDFLPYWGIAATLRLEGRETAVKLDAHTTSELHGDGIIYLADQANVPGALGYHDENLKGLPCGFVFTELAAKLREDYSVTLSHEALELIADANVNKLAIGPHPDPEEGGFAVLHWYEMCDAVQDETYEIDGVRVSNFVLPLYFTPGEQAGARNDFLNNPGPDGRRLTSFGVKPGGYVGFLNPRSGKMETWYLPDDENARRRLADKETTGITRRTTRRLEAFGDPALGFHLEEAQEKYGRAA
jgi:hypothetical protein